MRDHAGVVTSLVALLAISYARLACPRLEITIVETMIDDCPWFVDSNHLFLNGQHDCTQALYDAAMCLLRSCPPECGDFVPAPRSLSASN